MGLAAISYDPVRTLADFSVRRGITFPLLSDAGSETIKRYGILNTTMDPKNELYGIHSRAPLSSIAVESSRRACSNRFTRSGARSRVSSSGWAGMSMHGPRR